jgi:hypothetical protein
MFRNKQMFLSLVAILAVASFGFTSFGAVNSVTGGTYSITVQSLPASSSNLITTTSGRCGDNDGNADDRNCGEDGSNDADADENLAAVKVGPQLAGLCALAKLPSGTVVDSVSGIFAELSFPYYQVDLHNGNFAYTRFVNATNCNIVPDPTGS